MVLCDGSCGEGLYKDYSPLILRLFSLSGRTNSMGFAALPLCPHKVELCFIHVLREQEDLARETLFPWWERIDFWDIPSHTMV